MAYNNDKTEKLNFIKKKCENMSIIHQEEVLRIFINEKNITINENNNGSFINLSDLNNGTLEKLLNFINFVNNQEKYLKNIETQKEILEKNYFN